jgi:transcriptional regulator with XRE-family HTH domain
MQSIGERIKARRTALGITQAEVVKRAAAAGGDVLPMEVIHWEKGRRVPRAETIAVLAKALECSADYLLGLTDKPSRCPA